MRNYVKHNMALAYSDAIKVGDAVFVAGQGPNSLDVSPEEQVRQTLQNVENTLLKAGAKLSDVVKVTVILNYSIITPQTLEGIYTEFFTDPYPVRTIFNSEIGFNIQIDATAVIMG